MKSPKPSTPTPEQAVLGAILGGAVNPQTNDAIDALLKAAPGSFRDPRHGVIATAIRELSQSSMKVNTASTCKRLSESRRLQSAGGPGYVCGLLHLAAQPAQLPEFLTRLLYRHNESQPQFSPAPASELSASLPSEHLGPEFIDNPADDQPSPLPLNLHARVGKIARLPIGLRDQLNSRLLDAEPVEELLGWLNAVPEVQAILTQLFGGHPINKQNVSEWRRGGFQDWLVQQQAAHIFLRLSEDAAAIGPVAVVNFAEQLAIGLASRLAIMIDRFDPRAGDLEDQARVAHQLFRDLATLRNAAYKRERLALQKEALALRRTESERRAERERVRELRLQRAEQERVARRADRTASASGTNGPKPDQPASARSTSQSSSSIPALGDFQSSLVKASTEPAPSPLTPTPQVSQSAEQVRLQQAAA